MPVPLDPVTLTGNGTVQVTLPNPSTILAVEVMNKSSFDLKVEGISQNGAPWQPSGTTKWYLPGTSCAGTVYITAVNTAQLANPGTSVALLTVYNVGEELPKNLDVATIPTQVIQANVSTISVLQNLGNPPGSQWLNVQPSDASSPTWSADNSGNLLIRQDNGGALATLVQLIANNANPIQFLANLVNWASTGDYNGQNLLLGKRKLISIQNGAGTPTNAFGVDSADNTFIRHNSNNQTVIYDKNGNQLMVIQSTGSLVMLNNVPLQMENSVGTPAPVLTALPTNELELRPTFNDGFRFRDVNGNEVWHMDTGGLGYNNSKNILDVSSNANTLFKSISGTIQLMPAGTLGATLDTNNIITIVGTVQTVNGSSGGSMSIIEGIAGPYKIFFLFQNNYFQAAAGQTITLKNAYANGAMVYSSGIGGINFRQAGVAQNISVQTSLASTGGTETNVTQLQGSANGRVPTNFNQISDNGGYAAAHFGFAWGIGK